MDLIIMGKWKKHFQRDRLETKFRQAHSEKHVKDPASNFTFCVSSWCSIPSLQLLLWFKLWQVRVPHREHKSSKYLGTSWSKFNIFHKVFADCLTGEYTFIFLWHVTSLQLHCGLFTPCLKLLGEKQRKKKPRQLYPA